MVNHGWVASVLLLACGSSASQGGQVGRDALILAASDRATMVALLADKVANGGLYFAEAACAAMFAKPGEIAAAQRTEFARCLTTLELRPSARKSADADVAVLEYPPGIEIEARLVGKPSRLKWIGFASRRDGDRMVPTITSAALEQLRIAGDVAAPSTVDAMRPGQAWAWIKVCLDDTGAAAAAPFAVGSIEAATAHTALAATWRFRPFELAGSPSSVCAMTLVRPPQATELDVEALPSPPPRMRSGRTPLLVGPEGARRIFGDAAIAPNQAAKSAIAHAGARSVKGEFQACVDEVGVVETVRALVPTGLAPYDAQLVDAMQRWRYEPIAIDGVPTAFCTSVAFHYSRE